MPPSNKDLTWTSPLKINLPAPATNSSPPRQKGEVETGNSYLSPIGFWHGQRGLSLRPLSSPRQTHAPLSSSWIVKETSNTVDLPNKIIVSVGTIMDDICLTEVPNLMIAALCFTRTAKERILNAGGDTHQCLHHLTLW
ncbi:hypothetical protein B0H14DRAFT_2649961 [Mycena olivaceomarginata]|nr:hypothetical protein B0H14DRAFT_2649961 [Mycena olivaceomarginata]